MKRSIRRKEEKKQAEEDATTRAGLPVRSLFHAQSDHSFLLHVSSIHCLPYMKLTHTSIPPFLLSLWWFPFPPPQPMKHGPNRQVSRPTSQSITLPGGSEGIRRSRQTHTQTQSPRRSPRTHDGRSPDGGCAESCPPDGRCRKVPQGT